MEPHQIIRALAARDPKVIIPVSSITDEEATVCITCDAVFEGTVTVWHMDRLAVSHNVTGPTPHDDDCPWHNAHEWVAAHPDYGL